jgi:CubicO group peptidase (beta-lactamase class C family)
MSNFTPLYTYVKSLVGDGHDKLPSAVIGVADRNGILGVEAFNAKADAIYLLFSITKPFVGMAMCQLWERGLINLNQPLRAYIPDFAPARTDVVTLWHLLTHTSGIDQAAFELMRAPSFPEDKIVDPRRLLRASTMQFRAGTHKLYNNLAFWAMQEVIENVSGQPLHAYLQDNIFGPLGAQDFSFHSHIADPARVMPTHGAENLINYERYVRQESPAAGLFGTVEGLLTVGQTLLNIGAGSPLGGRGVLAPLTLKAMTTPQTVGVPLANPDQDFMRSEWGLTFQLPGNREFIIADRLFGHNGWGGCMFWAYPDQGVCFALMTNLMDAGMRGVDTDRVHNVFASCL